MAKQAQKATNATQQKNGAELGKIFSDVFSSAGFHQFGKQSPPPEKECKCHTCDSDDCDNCDEPTKGDNENDEFLDAVIEHKAIFQRLGVMLALVSDLSIHIRPDLPRILGLLTECRNLVNDGRESIEGTSLQL